MPCMVMYVSVTVYGSNVYTDLLAHISNESLSRVFWPLVGSGSFQLGYVGVGSKADPGVRVYLLPPSTLGGP